MTISLLLPPQPEVVVGSELPNPFIDLLDPTDVESAMETLYTLQRLADTLTDHALTPDLSAYLATNLILQPIAYDATALSVVATEGFMDAVRRVLAAIRAGITRIIEWIRSVFTRKHANLERKIETAAEVKAEAQALQSTPTGTQTWEAAKQKQVDQGSTSGGGLLAYTYEDAMKVLDDLIARWERAKRLIQFVANDPTYRTNPTQIAADSPDYDYQKPNVGFPEKLFSNGWELPNMISAWDKWEQFLRSVGRFKPIADTIYSRSVTVANEITKLEKELTAKVKPDPKLNRRLEEVRRAYLVLNQTAKIADAWVTMLAPVFTALNTTLEVLRQTLEASELKPVTDTKYPHYML